MYLSVAYHRGREHRSKTYLRPRRTVPGTAHYAARRFTLTSTPLAGFRVIMW